MGQPEPAGAFDVGVLRTPKGLVLGAQLVLGALGSSCGGAAGLRGVLRGFGGCWGVLGGSYGSLGGAGGY